MRPLLVAALLAASAAFVASPAALAQPAAVAAPRAEPVDTAAVRFIRTHALERSRVMETALWLTDVVGPRLTGGPELAAANRWAVGRFAEWGIRAELEPWGTLGRGWQLERFAMMAHVAPPGGRATRAPVVAEQSFIVQGVPKAWSPGTGAGRTSRVSGDVVVIDPTQDADLDRWAGRLRDKVVLFGRPSTVDLGLDPIATRRDASALLGLASASGVAAAPPTRQVPSEAARRIQEAQARRARLFAEAPLAVLEPSGTGGHGAIRVMAAQLAQTAPGQRPAPWAVGAQTVPQVVLLDEHANRLMRLAAAGERVALDIDLGVRFLPPAEQHNVIAEIPGTDLAGEVVIIGAHIDSWHSGSGATDNAAGVSVVMEAARILQAFYAERGRGPRRTIRVGLWSGEEQGLHGSLGHVNRRYATIPAFGAGATAITPAQPTVSAYYNLDNGSGRIRGVYQQSNAAVGPIFRAWLDAYGDPDARTLTLQNTGGTDHLSFDAAGIPGFQFIQDPLAYGPQTWHTTMDTYDHLSEADLKPSAAIMALFAHQTAERDERLPRKPFTLAPSN